jgi:hypothetical protein
MATSKDRTLNQYNMNSRRQTLNPSYCAKTNHKYLKVTHCTSASSMATSKERTMNYYNMNITSQTLNPSSVNRNKSQVLFTTSMNEAACTVKPKP